MVAIEQCKTLPIGDVWEEYCRQCGVEAEGDVYKRQADGCKRDSSGVP